MTRYGELLFGIHKITSNSALPEKSTRRERNCESEPFPTSPHFFFFCTPQARLFARSLARSPSLENGKETSVTQPKLIIIDLGKDTE